MAGASNKQIEASLCENCFEVFFSKKQHSAHTATCCALSPAVSKTGSVVSSTLSKCNQCRRIFLGSDHLESHVKRDHSNVSKEKPPKVVVMKTILQCNACTKIFMDPGLLEKHINQEHPVTKEESPGKSTPVNMHSKKCALKSGAVQLLTPVKAASDGSALAGISPETTTSAEKAAAGQGTAAVELNMNQPQDETVLTQENQVPEALLEASVEPETMIEASVEPETMIEASVEPETMIEASVEPETMIEASVEAEAMMEASADPGAMIGAAVEDVITSEQDVDTLQTEAAEAEEENGSHEYADISQEDVEVREEDVIAAVEEADACDTVTTDVHMEDAVVADLAADSVAMTDQTAAADSSLVSETDNGATPVDDQVAAEQLLMDHLTSQLEAVHGEPPSAPDHPVTQPQRQLDVKLETQEVISKGTAATSPVPATPKARSPAKASVVTAGTPRQSQTFYACSYCNIMFTSKDPLLKHLEQEHADQATRATQKAPATKTMYACAVCDTKYPTMKLVQQHIQQAHEPKMGDKSRELVGRRQESVWSTSECGGCPKLRHHSERLRDVYMDLNEWTCHYYGNHQKSEKPKSGKRLFLHPCHSCGVVFMSRASRLHHNVIAHEGCDPEELMRSKKLAAENAEKRAAENVEQVAVEPKHLSAKARSKVIVDSLMKASLVNREVPAVPMDRVSARKQQQKVFSQRQSKKQRLTQVVFKCSKCGGIFPDDPSFEKHAREEHANDPIGADGDAPSMDQAHDTSTTQSEQQDQQQQATPATPAQEEWDVLCQRECDECSTLMQSCPRSFALFVPRDVWEAHVEQVHAAARWRCTGETLHLHPCDQCPRLFLHPTTLAAHKEKLHETMLSEVTAEEIEACQRTDTIQCSKCSQMVQNADGLHFLEGGAWQKHFEGEHKQLLRWDGSAGHWKLWACNKCHRLFFNEKDLPVHLARQAYMHMPVPANVKVTTLKGGPKTPEEMELLYQCANNECPFSSKQHDEIISHSQQCTYASPAQFGETVLYKTVLLKKPPRRKRIMGSRNKPRQTRLDNVIQKLHGEDSSESSTNNLLQPGTTVTVQQFQGEGVIELDPVTQQPRLSIPLAMDDTVPEAAAVEETVVTEEQPVQPVRDDGVNSEDDASHVTRMDFACGVCNERGSSRQEIVAHIKRRHRHHNQTAMVRVAKPGKMTESERAAQVQNYTHTYLCEECKRMVMSCPRTQDLYFEKDSWLEHLRTTHQPTGYNELDRLDLHECTECPRLLLSVVSHKRHVKYFHMEGSENLPPPPAKQPQQIREGRHKFRCFEEGCNFSYHRASRIRSHLIQDHNFDLAVREVHFKSEEEFQNWKKDLEMNTGSCFLLRSSLTAKRRGGTFHVRYHECSRVMTHMPSTKQNGKSRSLPWQADMLKQDMVWRCPAFLKAEVPISTGAPRGIRVTFCPNHYGHEMDPTFGRLSDEEEGEIAQLLMSGLAIPDVVKRMREEARLEGVLTRKQRVTEAEVNRICEKYLGLKPPKYKRNFPNLPACSFGKRAAESRERTLARSQARQASESSGQRAASVVDSEQNTEPVIAWNADFISSNVTVENSADGTVIAYAADDGSQYEEHEYVEEEYQMEEQQQPEEPEPESARDTWQRICGEEDCDFTTNSVGFLRHHLRSAHGFAMHIDTVRFPLMKHFNKWKRNLEKRTCAKYSCYKSVASEDPNSAIETRHFTCHRSGLINMRRPSVATPLPKRLVLCTGYMKLRVNQNSGEVVCEYCASHYGHDARLVPGRPMGHVSLDMPVFEAVEHVVEDVGHVQHVVTSMGHVVETVEHVVDDVGQVVEDVGHVVEHVGHEVEAVEHVVEEVGHVVEAVDHVEVEVEDDQQIVMDPSQYAFVTDVQQEYEVHSTPLDHHQARPAKRSRQVRQSHGGKRRRWEQVEQMVEEQMVEEQMVEEQMVEMVEEEEESFESD